MIERHLLKLRARAPVGEDEEQAIRDAVGEVRTYPADHVVIRAGQRIEASTLLLDGIMCRHKDLSEGQRQIRADDVWRVIPRPPVTSAAWRWQIASSWTTPAQTRDKARCRARKW